MHTYKTREGRTVMSTKCRTSTCFCDARASRADGKCDDSCTTGKPCNATQLHCLSTFSESMKPCKRLGCPCESRRFDHCCNTCAAGTKCAEAHHSAEEYGVTIFKGPIHINLVPSGEQNRERGVTFRRILAQKGECEAAYKSSSLSMSNMGAGKADCDLLMPTGCINMCVMAGGIFDRELFRDPSVGSYTSYSIKELRQHAKRPHGELTCDSGPDNEPVLKRSRPHELEGPVTERDGEPREADQTALEANERKQASLEVRLRESRERLAALNAEVVPLRAKAAESYNVVCKKRAGEAFQEIRDHLTCPICLGQLKKPLVLPCGHHFCRDCINKWLHPDKLQCGPRKDPKCPCCKKPIMTTTITTLGSLEKVMQNRLSTEDNNLVFALCHEDLDELATTMSVSLYRRNQPHFLGGSSETCLHTYYEKGRF